MPLNEADGLIITSAVAGALGVTPGTGVTLKTLLDDYNAQIIAAIKAIPGGGGGAAAGTITGTIQADIK